MHLSMLTFSIQNLFIHLIHGLLLCPMLLWRQHLKMQTTVIHPSIHFVGQSEGSLQGFV